MKVSDIICEKNLKESEMYSLLEAELKNLEISYPELQQIKKKIIVLCDDNLISSLNYFKMHTIYAQALF